jgi:succinate dehydrogenase / fumarate reductase, iron-sulfur subunit
MNLKVFRYDPGVNGPRYDVFRIEPAPGMTVLTALFAAQEQYDESLAFRYSCRGAVCGSCAMLIDNVPRLACRTQVQALLEGKLIAPLSPSPEQGMNMTWDPAGEILVEPLPNLPVVRDLIVDMSPFFTAYRSLHPVFSPAGTPPEKEHPMVPAEVKKLEPYTNCILCGACFGACPVNTKNPRYPGPAALAQLYRFHIDPREKPGPSRLDRADNPDGWWACEFHTNCRRVCPRGVPPDRAIGFARRELSEDKKTRERAGK